MNKQKTSLEVGIDSLGNYTPADWRLEAEKGIISALADQKAKMIQIVNNTKLCVSGITAQREFKSRLLKEFEELK